MTTEQFTYWLQWFAEINSSAPSDEQWKIIKDHLALVFDKKTPIYSVDTNKPEYIFDKFIPLPTIKC